MKKTNFVKLLMAVMVLGLLFVPVTMNGANIRVVSENNGNENTNKEEPFPHRAPAHYSHLAGACWNAETGVLSIGFNAEADDVTISIYNNDTLIDETMCSVIYGSVKTFNLSSCGSGDYEIVITGIGDDDLHGYFTK